MKLNKSACIKQKIPSLPIWERGLKHMMEDGMDDYDMVAPYMGAWIETHTRHGLRLR